MILNKHKHSIFGTINTMHSIFFCVCDAIALYVFLHCLRGSMLVHLLLSDRVTTGKLAEETDPIKINLYLHRVHHS